MLLNNKHPTTLRDGPIQALQGIGEARGGVRSADSHDIHQSAYETRQDSLSVRPYALPYHAIWKRCVQDPSQRSGELGQRARLP